MFAYPSPQSQKTKLSNWLEETGVGRWESESLPIERLEALLGGFVQSAHKDLLMVE
jgi:hypothetical protein